MNESTQQIPPTPDTTLIQEIRFTAANMSLWLKILGIVSILSGVLVALSIIGLIFAWIPIWMGILLFQAGDRAQSLQYTDNFAQLLAMLRKLKTYFTIYGVLTIIGIVMGILSMIMIGSFMEEFTRQAQEMMTYYF
ncbi:MAG: hypothetical protein D6732_16345 [Methanobacteriota archaeon]|nr:MAG: hypothetical protein D6732_16345 [Euryarchaeota archaeon]